MTSAPVLPAPPAPRRASPAPARSASRRGLPYGWPLTALLGGLGVWWAVGLNGVIVHLLAVPMLWQLMQRRRVRLPPRFGLWLVFLAWTVASLVMIDYNPPGTVQDVSSGRLIAVGYRLASYLAATVALVYAGNLDLTRYPQRKLTRVLGIGFIWVVLGGLLGLLVPHLQFVSPVERVLPGGLRANLFVRSLVHPSAAQVQDVLGYAAPRPAAPFGYTNMWGHNYALLLPWFVVGFVLLAPRRARALGIAFLCLAAVPGVWSLNRGMWIGVGISVVYLVVRLVLQGRLWVAAVAVAGSLAGGALIAFSPLQAVVNQRIDNGASNAVRSYSVEKAVDIAKLSPILGYGNTRTAIGSNQSIAVGKSPTCPRCGNVPLGINGHLWLEVVAHGFVGAGLYVATFLAVAWRYRRDRTAIGMAGVLTVLLMLWFMFVYGALASPLTFAFLGWAALWRNEQQRGQPA